MDTALFFPERGDMTAVRAAKATCEQCYVTDACLTEHIYEREGIFGGSTPLERRRIRLALGFTDPQDPVPMQPCGTAAAYRRHLRNSEPPCQPCIDANRIAAKERNARRYRACG